MQYSTLKHLSYATEIYFFVNIVEMLLIKNRIVKFVDKIIFQWYNYPVESSELN